MTTQTSPAFDLMPPPPLAARRPLKRTASYGETRFDGERKGRAAPVVEAVATSVEPGFWDRFDELARTAAEASWLRTKALGREALESVQTWRKGAAPIPRAKVDTRLDDAQVVGPLLVSAQLEEVRRATDGFARAMVALGASIHEASEARDAIARAARPRLVAHFGDELVDEVALVPSLRRVVEMHSKRPQMGAASLDDVMKLVGDDWRRDPDAGAGKLVVCSGDGAWQLTVDVAFATLRVRERHTGRFVDATGAPVVAGDPEQAFARTHFRID